MRNPKNAFKTFVENPKRNISANKPASHKLSASSQLTLTKNILYHPYTNDTKSIVTKIGARCIPVLRQK